MIRLGVVWAGA